MPKEQDEYESITWILTAYKGEKKSLVANADLNDARLMIPFLIS